MSQIEKEIRECFVLGFTDIIDVSDLVIDTKKTIFVPDRKNFSIEVSKDFKIGFPTKIRVDDLFKGKEEVIISKKFSKKKYIDYYEGILTDINVKVKSISKELKPITFEKRISSCYNNSLFLMEKYDGFTPIQICGSHNVVYCLGKTRITKRVLSFSYSITVLTLNLNNLLRI